jgi:hypothetical protein
MRGPRKAISGNAGSVRAWKGTRIKDMRQHYWHLSGSCRDMAEVINAASAGEHSVHGSVVNVSLPFGAFRLLDWQPREVGSSAHGRSEPSFQSGQSDVLSKRSDSEPIIYSEQGKWRSVHNSLLQSNSSKLLIQNRDRAVTKMDTLQAERNECRLSFHIKDVSRSIRKNQA